MCERKCKSQVGMDEIATTRFAVIKTSHCVQLVVGKARIMVLVQKSVFYRG